MADEVTTNEVTIMVRPNGPYSVRGPIKLVDGDGNEFTLTDSRIVLCRCGQSSNKPFCDSTHRAIGWESAPKAE
jgi:CDGSH iron-sulfur domain-containing protein 3